MLRSEQNVLISTASSLYLYKRCFEELSGEQVVSDCVTL